MEEKRPGMHVPIHEDEGGTFIFNSKDLCMIRHIPELIESGITSFKIEGRIKSEYYVAAVTKAYREAIDAYYDGRPFEDRWEREVEKVSHREYETGFYFGKRSNEIYGYGSYIRDYDMIGLVRGLKEDKLIISQRNRFFKGDEIEVLPPSGSPFTFIVAYMENEDGEEIDVAPHPEMYVSIRLPKEVLQSGEIPTDSILRKKNVKQFGKNEKRQ